MMKSGLKNTLFSVLFIIGLIGLLYLGSRILAPKGNDKEDGMYNASAHGILSEPKDTIDVLIIGNSESVFSMIPMQIWEQYGIPSYCCATTGQRLSYSEQFLYKAFQNQTPKIVILETNNIFKEIPYQDAALHTLESSFSIFTYHNRWKTMSLKDLNLNVEYTHIDDNKGYFFTTDVAAANDSGYMKESSDVEAIPSLNRYYIDRIISFCRKKGVRLIFISTPSTKNWNSKRHNGVQRLSGETGIDFLDMNTLREEIPIDWKKDTIDRGDHMNYYGARKVTDYLGRYLAETGLLTDRRNEKAYEPWNESLGKFNEMVRQALEQDS